MSTVRGGYLNSRNGLTARTAQAEHVSVNIDSHVDSLIEDLGKLKKVGQAISEEATLQQQMMDNLELAMDRARTAMSVVQKKLDKVYRQSKSNFLLYVMLFALAIFFLVYSYKRTAAFMRWIH